MGEVLKFPTSQERQPLIEHYAESIESAHELMAELMEYDRVDMYGAEATAGINETRALSAELTALLDTIPDAVREQAGLRPRSPSEKMMNPEQSENVTTFPDTAEYAHVLGYPHQLIPEAEQVAVDQQQEPSPGQKQAA